MRPDESELRAGIEAALADVGLEPTGPIERRPSPYRTSFPIEELQVELAGRGPVKLACKRLEWDGLEPAAQLAKPSFLHDAEREPGVYRGILPRAPAGPPEFFGSLLEEGRSWLFVEWVEGRELFQVGERSDWEGAARWLARFHVALAPELERHRREAPLIEHDVGFYRGWMKRAREFAVDPRRGGAAVRVEWLGERHDQVVEALLAMPRTMVHGEFYASNVLVADNRVAPVDWELAGVGPGLTDLAALVSGWPDADRRALAVAYASQPGVPGFTHCDLDLVRLQVAIQWLGWAPPEWEPPEGQRHDWLAEAVGLAEELGL